MEAAGVWMAAQLEVILWTTAIFVADVTLANIARKYDDFLWIVKNACLAMTHATPYSNSRNTAFLCPRTAAPAVASPDWVWFE